MRVALVAMMVCLATPAWADLSVYSRSGGWDAFKGTDTDGRQTCGIGSTNPADGRAFSLRFAVGEDGITFVASSPHWNIPEDTRVPVVTQIGLDRPWTEQAMGHVERVEWSMARDVVPSFDAQFRRASSMTVTFPAGSERPWIISLNGSTAASNAMGRCVTAMTQNAAPARPPRRRRRPTRRPYGSATGPGPAAAQDAKPPSNSDAASPVQATPLQVPRHADPAAALTGGPVRPPSARAPSANRSTIAAIHRLPNATWWR